MTRPSNAMLRYRLRREPPLNEHEVSPLLPFVQLFPLPFYHLKHELTGKATFFRCFPRVGSGKDSGEAHRKI